MKSQCVNVGRGFKESSPTSSLLHTVLLPSCHGVLSHLSHMHEILHLTTPAVFLHLLHVPHDMVRFMQSDFSIKYVSVGAIPALMHDRPATVLGHSVCEAQRFNSPHQKPRISAYSSANLAILNNYPVHMQHMVHYHFLGLV